MNRIGDVKEIKEIKQYLEQLRQDGLIRQWELPYENLLTRLTAAHFFVQPAENQEQEVQALLSKLPQALLRPNPHPQLSSHPYELIFEEESRV